MSGGNKDTWQAMVEGTRVMEECYRELDRADKEVLRFLQDSTGIRGRTELSLSEYLSEHKQKTSGLRHSFAESARGVELVIERAQMRFETGLERREIETTIERMVGRVNSNRVPVFSENRE